MYHCRPSPKFGIFENVRRTQQTGTIRVDRRLNVKQSECKWGAKVADVCNRRVSMDPW